MYFTDDTILIEEFLLNFPQAHIFVFGLLVFLVEYKEGLAVLINKVLLPQP